MLRGPPPHGKVEDRGGGRGGFFPGGKRPTKRREKVLDANRTREERTRQYGVTSGQVQACWYGVMHGWDYARANPMAYNLAGDYLGV